MRDRTYQAGFYRLSHKVRDRGSRLRQAAKIAYILTTFGSYPLASATCLDIGCSSGTITSSLAPLFARMIGIDYDAAALTNIERAGSGQPHFLRGDAMRLPLPDDSIDVIICAQVYEHVPSDVHLVAEIYRVLKPGGIVFFSGPNKLFPIEPHYYLPFLHWLPGSWADRYLHMLRRGEHYYERSRTLWSLRRLLTRFIIHDVTSDVVHWTACHTKANRWAQLAMRVPSIFWELMLPLFPNYNWILHKPVHEKSGAQW